MTTLRRQLDDLDMISWAALTKQTAERAVAAAQQADKEAPERLIAIAAMSTAELIDLRRRSSWQPKPARPTLRMKLVESEHRRALAKQRVQVAEQDKKDALAVAAAARAEASASAEAANEARERTRAATEELLRKELQLTSEQLETQAELESLRNEVTQAHAFEKGARADAKEAAAAAAAAKEREVAALDKFALQGAQLAGAERKLRAALDKSQAAEEKMRAELDQVRADSAAEIAAAIQHASAADQRAEERLAERAADRRAAQFQIERLHGEIVKVRSDAESEVAAAQERTKGAENRALLRMSERSADRVAARETIDKLQYYLEQARAQAEEEIQTAREQAVLAIATARAAGDKIVARIRADARLQVDEAVFALEKAVADRNRAQEQQDQLVVAGGLAVPIPPSTIRPTTRAIENALNRLHQIDYILEVGTTEEVEAEIPLDAELVERLARAVQRQAPNLRQELIKLPTRFDSEPAKEAAATYAKAAGAAFRNLLNRIESAAGQLNHSRANPNTSVLGAVAQMLADTGVREFLAEPGRD